VHALGLELCNRSSNSHSTNSLVQASETFDEFHGMA
jgi:hypothetical protein